MNDNKNNPADIKEGFFGTDIFSLAVMLFVITALSLLSALGIGGISAIGVSGAAFAFLLVSRKNISPWICVPVSFGTAYLVSGDAVTAAQTQLFILVGVVLAGLVIKKKSLSVTVAVLTVVVAICGLAYFTFFVTDTYGNDIKEAYLSFGADLEAGMKEMLDAFRYEDKEQAGPMFGLTEESINEILRSLFMLLFAIAAIICQLMAYGAAKLCRLACHIFGYDGLYSGSVKEIRVSAPAGIIFIVSYFISFLSRGESVIAYSAINLTYMLMPMLAIGGFHELFSRGGIIRRKSKSPFKMAVIISCGICALLSPLSFIPLLSMFGAMGPVARAVADALREKRNNKDEN